jgi:site-specific DNA-methyltransferase (adenine-specific)
MDATVDQIMARFSSATDEWGTPQELYNELDREFSFNFDPCPMGGIDDGSAPLFVSWRGKRVFCNPPYSNIRAFLERAQEAEIAVFLIPSRTDVRWFHEIVLPHAKEIRFIRGRVQFSGRVKDNAPFPSMIVVFEATR